MEFELKRIFIVFILVISNLWAQDETPVDLKQLFCGVIGVSTGFPVTHTLQSVYPNIVWKLVGTYFLPGGINHSTLTTYGNVNLDNNIWEGFNFEWFPHTGNPSWALGFYKVSNSLQANSYFYLDARDSDYGRSTNTDIFIYYNNITEKYYYRTVIAGQYQQIEITNGSILRVSEIRGNSYSTDLLLSFWENCLVSTISSNGENPRLVWGKPNNFTAEGYRIYWRMFETGPFQLLTTVGPNIYTYTHEDLLIGGSSIVEYFLVAFNSHQTMGPSNIVIYETSTFYKELIYQDKAKKSVDLAVYLYPNPSFDVVNIQIVLPKYTCVELELFDANGALLKKIFQGISIEGQLQFTEQISYLSHGVYFIKVSSARQSLVKSFIHL